MVRVITAILLGLIVFAIVWFMPAWGIDALVLVACALGLWEFGKMFLAGAAERWSVLIAGLAVASNMIFWPGEPVRTLLLIVFALFVLTFIFASANQELSGCATRLAAGIMGVVYLGIAFPFWSWINGLPEGKALVLLVLVPACLCDTFALVAGKAFGKHKMAPRMSPNKTVEGLFGALAGSFAGIFLMRWLVVPTLPVHDALVLVVLIWVTSPYGDLVESFFKRSSGVKDSGTIIPGHGGVLDRLDALVFTGPAAFAYMKYAMGM